MRCARLFKSITVTTSVQQMGVEDAIRRNGCGVPQNEDVDPEYGKVEGKTGVKDASEWDDDGPSSPPQERDARKPESFLH